MTEICLLEYGTEGGGASVYKLSNNNIIERGSRGGILDKIKDPIVNWEKKYDSWDLWWKKFTRDHKYHWVRFYPVYIHPEISNFIKTELKKNHEIEYETHHINFWLEKLK